jgi:hypothetical protein
MRESNEMDIDILVETVYLIKFSSEDGNEAFICGGDTEKIANEISENVIVDYLGTKSIHKIDLFLDDSFDFDNKEVYPVYEINESGEKEFIILFESEEMVIDFFEVEGFVKDKKVKIFRNNDIIRVYDEIKLFRE